MLFSFHSPRFKPWVMMFVHFLQMVLTILSHELIVKYESQMPTQHARFFKFFGITV